MSGAQLDGIPELGELLGESEGASVLPAALQVRELIEKHARREAELEALYDAARDLTRVRDVERTLQAVTERARRLLRCDLAYLSAATKDDGQDFAVRAWSGQLSPAFLGTKVSTGSGVGGQVAATRRPCQVEDYQKTDQISHTDYLDSQVGAENIVALLGVPLEIDGRLLGILFAGRRVAHRFEDREVRLLSSLAAHAAVALDNAELFASQHAALAELERIAQELRDHNAAVETAAEVHAQLTDVLLRGQGVDAIVQVVADALGVGIAMVDLDEVLVAAHGDGAPAGRLPGIVAAEAGYSSPIRPPFSAEIRRAIAASREIGRSVQAHAADGHRMYVSAASAGTTFLGSLLLITTRKLTDVDVRTFERATQAVAVSLLADTAIADADRRAASDVMRQLLDVRHTAPHAVERIARRHLLTGGPITVIVTDALDAVPAERDAALLASASRLCRDHGGLSAVYEDQLVLVQPGDEHTVGERAWNALRAVTLRPFRMAVGRPTTSLLELGHLYAESRQCLRLMHHLGREGTWAKVSEFGMYSLLFTSGMEDRLEHFVNSQVGTLLQYDARHDTQLAVTALAYLDSMCSPSTAASMLGVHANTVAQRIGRIDRLLDPDWRASPRSLEVHTALRLSHLREQLRDGHWGAGRP